jgi:hypothetical protein
MLLKKQALEIWRGSIGDYPYGVQICPDGSTTATNGHILFRYEPRLPGDCEQDFPSVDGCTPSPLAAPVSIGPDSCKNLIRSIPKSRSLPILNHLAVDGSQSGNGVLTAVTTDLESPTIHRVQKLDRDFPDWQKVVAGVKKPKATVIVSIKYLKMICETASKVGAERVELAIVDGESPIKFTADGDGTLTGCVMPMAK